MCYIGLVFLHPSHKKHQLGIRIGFKTRACNTSSQALEVIVGKSLAWRVLFHRVVRPIK